MKVLGRNFVGIKKTHEKCFHRARKAAFICEKQHANTVIFTAPVSSSLGDKIISSNIMWNTHSLIDNAALSVQITYKMKQPKDTRLIMFI